MTGKRHKFYSETPAQASEFKGKFGSGREGENLVPGEKAQGGRTYQPGVTSPPLDGLPSAPAPTVRPAPKLDKGAREVMADIERQKAAPR